MSPSPSLSIPSLHSVVRGVISSAAESSSGGEGVVVGGGGVMGNESSGKLSPPLDPEFLSLVHDSAKRSNGIKKKENLFMHPPNYVQKICIFILYRLFHFIIFLKSCVFCDTVLNMNIRKCLFAVSFILVFSVYLVSCGAKDDPATDNTNPFTSEGSDSAVTAGLAALAGVVQLGNDAGGAISGVDSLSVASTCGNPATTESCLSGSQSIIYGSCSLANGVSYSGTVTLLYYDNSCSLATDGYWVKRTATLSRSGFLDSVFSTTTVAHKDYRGNDIGAGAELTKTSSGYTVDILGIRKTRKTTTAEISVDYNISVRTTSDMTMTGSLNGSRTLNSGEVEVINNTKTYVAKFTPSSLVYSSTTCCHPTSGSLTFTYSGSVGGSAVVNFQSDCGVVEFVRGDITTSLKLHGCE